MGQSTNTPQRGNLGKSGGKPVPPIQGLTIRRVPIDSIHQDPSNARSHGDVNMAAIESSLRRFGQAEPLVVQAKTGRVIGGNGRLGAMKKLGWAECDVVELDVDDLQATALGIALNRTAELAEWDEPVLAKILDELRSQDALDGVGYTGEDLDKILEELAADIAPAEVEDHGAEEPPEKPVSRRGDLWVLGNHRLLCGDSTNAEDLARLMAGEKASLLATDPPYCVDYTGDVRPGGSGKDWSSVYREIDIKDLGDFLRAVFRSVLPHLVDDAAIYVWHAHLQYPVIDRVFEEFGILRHQPIIWKKPSSTFTYSFYRWAHEPCLFGWKQGHKPPHYLENGLTSVWEVDWEGKKRIVGNEHPCLHPDALVLTESGYRPIRSVAVGDMVYSADGCFHPVSDVSSHPYQSKELYRIVAKGGNVSTLASDNHLFLVWRPEREKRRVVGGDVSWIRADELRLGDYLMTPMMGEGEADPFPEKDDWFLSGLYLEHQGRTYTLRDVESVERVPYEGDVWNLSVSGNPSFQTAVGMSHNTQKPTRLFEIPMEQHTKAGAVVLEPFSGSGSQIVAAEKLGRRCRAMEISPAFVDAAIVRWEKATGKKAVLDGTEKTFGEIKEERRLEAAKEEM